MKLLSPVPFTPLVPNAFHKTALSVNVNKVALLRNTRHLDIPSVRRAAELCLEAGAQGITVHPRPDERHIRPDDVFELAALMKDWPDREFNIEGNPDSPINRGTLCPKGAASFQLAVNPLRATKALYRKPGGTQWGPIELNQAMDMIVDRIVRTRDETWQEETPKGDPAKRTMGIANLGGATLDNEENYLIKKLLTALGIVQVENQARI